MLAEHVQALRKRVAVLAMALRHPRTPWQARVVGSLTLLYALSPIDLIPDVIPILGHLDDLVLVPLGIWLTVKLIPRDVWAECEAEVARTGLPPLAKDWRGVLLVAVIWVTLVAGALGVWWALR